MMDQLLPLYLEEAFDRIERIEGLLQAAKENPEACKLIRRELHTLKGSSRMMGLRETAELCHRGEDLLIGENSPQEPAFRSLVGEMRQALKRLGEGTSSEPEKKKEIPPPQEPDEKVRVRRSLLDGLSDQSVRMRVLAQETLGLIDGLHSLARTAEHAVTQGNHAQVLASLATRLRSVAVTAERSQRRFETMVESQYRALRSQQIQPVRPFLEQLARHALSLAESQEKPLEVSVDVQDCGLDRRIMDALREALIHLVRNAVDHGLETENERRTAGKKGGSGIVFRAVGLGERIRIEVEDNGHGINRKAVLETAVQRGLVDEAQAADLGDEILLSFLFEPGFSTRKSVGTVSGRGVGLDVVASTVQRVGGEIWIESPENGGTRFILEIPVLHLAERILVVEAASYRVAFPQALVRSFRKVAQENNGDDDPSTGLKRESLDLRGLWGPGDAGPALGIEVETAGLNLEILVDDILGEEDIFLRPWPLPGDSAGWVDGMALLRDGRPVVVIDLYRLYLDQRRGWERPERYFRKAKHRHVLLVDDSEITREVFRRDLIEAGVDVHALPSAETALWYLEEHHVDCLLTDIEMPEMDGLELTRKIRRTANLSQLPIILISTRNSREDRLAGLNAGADAYIAKQNFNIEELLRLIRRFGVAQ